MFGNTKLDTHLSVIIAKKNSNILSYWIDEIKKRLRDYNSDTNIFWSFLGNNILDPYLKSSIESNFNIIDKYKNYFIVEENFKIDNEYNIDNYTNYRNFWYYNNFIDYIENYVSTQSTIYSLHNSWTPIEIKNMSTTDFLSLDCTLSNLLSNLLELKVNRYFYYNILTKKIYKITDESYITNINDYRNLS